MSNGGTELVYTPHKLVGPMLVQIVPMADPIVPLNSQKPIES